MASKVSLLVVPDGQSDEWRESILRPIPYAIVPAFTELAQLHREVPDESRRRLWQDALQRSVDPAVMEFAQRMVNDHTHAGDGMKAAATSANVRLPDLVVGDIEAQHATCCVGEARWLELLERYGRSTFDDCAARLLDYGERLTREAIAAWPFAGEYDLAPIAFQLEIVPMLKATPDIRGSRHLR